MAVKIQGLYGTRGGGRVGFKDLVSNETTAVFAPVQFYDDFVGGDIVIPATTTVESGCSWSTKIVGTTTVAGVANAAGGVVACALGAQLEKQDAVLYFDDQLTFPLNSAVAAGTGGMGLVFEARCKLSVLATIDPGGDACIFIGMAGAWGDDKVMLSTLHPRMGFHQYGTGAGLIYCVTDDATTESGLVTSGHTVTAAQWHVFRIDASTPASIKFYIDGNRVASGTTFTMVGAPSASVVLQPYISASKTTHEAVGTVQVDYVRIWANRA